MTINKIKEDIQNNIGKRVKIVLNSSRNKQEKFDAILSDAYPFVFLVKLETDELCETKSFSYSDVLTETIVIHYQ